MVKIRLARHGSKKNPCYHVVVADSRMPRDGRFIEQVGRFVPLARGKETRLELAHDRIEHWVQSGALASERVARLIKDSLAAADKPAQVRPTRNEQKREQIAQAAEAASKKQKAEAKAAIEAAKTAEASEESSSDT